MSGNPNPIAAVVGNDSVPYEQCYLPYKPIQVAVYHISNVITDYV